MPYALYALGWLRIGDEGEAEVFGGLEDVIALAGLELRREAFVEFRLELEQLQGDVSEFWV